MGVDKNRVRTNLSFWMLCFLLKHDFIKTDEKQHYKGFLAIEFWTLLSDILATRKFLMVTRKRSHGTHHLLFIVANSISNLPLGY